MAQNLQLLKRRIKTAKNISQIAKAMEMISASKIKRAQTAVENNKPYSNRISVLTRKLIKTLQSESSKRKAFSHPYINLKTDSTKKLMIAISPDKGLCGSLNTNLFKKMMEVSNPDIQLITIGTKVSRFATKLDSELIASFPMGTSLPTFGKVYELKRIIDEYYNSGKVSEVQLVYSEFTSFFMQTPIVKTILPISKAQEETVEGEEEELPYLFEPNLKDILQSLLPYYLEIMLYSSLIEAYTSEQAARMMAMQNAKNNAQDIANLLTLAYNKSRQERITAEILDITNTAV